MTDQMTPDEAREHLAWPEGKDHPKVRDGSGQVWFEVQAGESHPYWNRLPDAPYEDAVMYAAARAALATIAGMREEWGVEYTGVNHGGRHTEWGYETRAEAERQARRYRLCTDMHPVHVVRRYVTNEEEA